jgi:hypothetical protein
MTGRLLLVGWDAADWKILHPLIDAGEMPALRRIVETGASGSLLSAQPLEAVAQWTTIATGKRPWQHRVCHPLEWNSETNEVAGVTAARRCSLALWELLAQAGKRNLIVGWPATHGERTDNTFIVSDRYALPTAGPGIKPWPPAAPGTYWPEEIGARLNELRMSPADVQSDIVSRYVPDWRKIDQKRDRRLGQLRLYLATDFSHQAALMALLSSAKWDFAAVRFPALGAISELFVDCHLSRSAGIFAADCALYQNVFRNACRMLDEMLSLAVKAAGPDASVVVVSGHGVSQHTSTPARMHAGDIDAWKSPHGIFAACGPGLARDALVCGATVLDVAPTILTWFGLPIGDDMEGRVLIESFAKAPEVTRVASWEPASRIASPPTLADAVIPDGPKAAVVQRREYDWNLAQSFLEIGREADALPLLEGLFRAFPERSEWSYALFRCQLALEKISEAADTLEVVLEGLPAGIWPLLARAELCAARGDFREARSLIDKARELNPTHPDALRRLGLLLLKLREWDALERVARRALELNDDEALAWLGLAEAQLRKHQPAEAEEAASRAIGLNYYMADAHFILARSFIAQGKWEQAREAMRVLLRFQPDNRVAATYAKQMERRSGLHSGAEGQRLGT